MMLQLGRALRSTVPGLMSQVLCCPAGKEGLDLGCLVVNLGPCLRSASLQMRQLSALAQPALVVATEGPSFAV